MSGMHMLPVYYTTTNQKKRKPKKVTAKMQAAQAEHEKFLKRMGYVPKGERCYGSTSDSKPLSWVRLPAPLPFPHLIKWVTDFVRVFQNTLEVQS